MNERPAPSRHLDLEGAYNVRDTGAYLTADGRHTRWRTLLRADSLHALTPASQTALIDHGLRTVVDLRTVEEVSVEPNVFAGSTVVTYRHMDMIGDMDGTEESAPTGGIPERISHSYVAMLDQRRTQICETLTTLAAPGILPAVVHCHGGKDRTGIVIALALRLMGVPVEAVAEDYALSAQFLLKRSLDGQGPAQEAHYSSEEEYRRECCPPEAMLLTLSHLERHYGGVESYLLGGGLDRQHVASLSAALVE
jgi:protein-tyrosine phosphatase